MSKNPRLYFPPGLVVSKFGASVTLEFQFECDADEFLDFVQWIEEITREGKTVDLRANDPDYRERKQ